MNINLVLYLVMAVCCSGALGKAYASQPLLSFSYDQAVTVCPWSVSPKEIPQFTEPQCHRAKLSEVDPQNKAVWVLIEFERAKLASIPRPVGLYLFAKTSSEVFLNGSKVGSSGFPAVDKTEQIGKMDSVFYLPDSLIKKSNQLVFGLSAQHSLISLGYPIHFVGLGQFGDPKQYIQSFSGLGLILVGAFLLGALYFISLSFGRYGNTSVRIFAALCLLAAMQLSAEISRGLVDYGYVWHDIRLLTVTALSFLFGTLLLVYSSLKVAKKHALHWIYIGTIVTLIVIIFAPGFDSKTTAGVFVPLLVSLVQLGYCWRRAKNNNLAVWFVVQLLVAATVLFVASSFHEITHFVIIAVLLVYLFIRQAKEYRAQQVQLSSDQAHIAKLEFKLAQNKQLQSPSKLEVSIAGKTDYVVLTDIAFCKAAGDYVELHMKDTTQKLFTGSLKQLELTLPSIFVKTHRSYLTNLNEVVSLESDNNQSNLKLTNGASVPVSRRLVSSVRATLKASTKP
ncbi:LytTR family DNA-binding domain-containing protein [Pseudoalteromonas sp. XMcav11-Q]|uniref:LytR/AlgR family response regulator transcription factor n=1 Tax=Pseudoalteromonas sp. XMcav11-Q TaxID=3136665 RepID=UPI0032C451DB